MNRDVMISVRGLQLLNGMADGDIETVQKGKYYFREGSHFLIYDEYMEDFQEPVHNVLRFKDGEVTLVKRGLVNVQMFFEEGKKTLTQYNTPFGSIMMGLDTRKIRWKEDPEGLHLRVNYVLEANYQYVADCRIRVEAKAQTTPESPGERDGAGGPDA